MTLATVPLGASGARVSRIGLGAMGFGTRRWRPWVVEAKEAEAILHLALDRGINLVDTADMYSAGVSEEIVGRAVRGREDDVIVSTKVFYPMGPGPNRRGLSRRWIRRAVRSSLERLGLPSIDLLHIHRWDPQVPPEETLAALSGLVDEGMVDYLGASTMWAWQFAGALAMQRARNWHRFVVMQAHYNLVYREEEREMLPLCRHEGIGVLPWSPLARGFLAGGAGARAATDAGRRFYGRMADEEIRSRAQELASTKGITLAQLSLAWLLHQPGVVAPIVGATQPRHVEDALAATEVRLSHQERSWLEEPYRPRGVAGWVRGSDVPRQHLDPEEPEGGLLASERETPPSPRSA